ncbi:hypothetical protein [Streptomyces sp. NPDC050759]|uniref:hypothetical protein n=1 Tax=Streptomyces sp. NPDC050759 TaxID=3365635 RepID=UPI0037A7E0F2
MTMNLGHAGAGRKTIRTGATVAMTAALAVASTVLMTGSAQADDRNNPGYHQLQVYVPSDTNSFSVVTRTPYGEKGYIARCINSQQAGWQAVGLVKNGDTVESWGYSVNCDGRTANDQLHYKKVVPKADSLTNYWLDLTK